MCRWDGVVLHLLIRGKMKLFKRNQLQKSYDPSTCKPVLKCSICTGEQVAGFVDLKTGVFEDIMLIRNVADLDKFKKQYGITEDMEKIY